MTTLSPAEITARLRLARTHSIGPVTFRHLLNRFSSAQNALDAIPHMAKNGGRKTPLTPFSQSAAEDEIAHINAQGGTLIVYGDKQYPPRLAAIPDAPCTLTVLGDPAHLMRPQIALVGARNASLPGRKITEQIASALGASGYVITSGLARGIDTCAHTASLKTGTIAVLAGGADIIYPQENTPLYQNIIEYGCIISEHPMGMQPTNMHFPRRNRIISGLSLGTVIIEAALKSGSLITASYAADQGREVFAVPGHPFDPRAAGPNTLIRDGATLVTNANDILQTLKSPSLIRESATGYFEPEITPPTLDEDALELARQEIIPLLGTMRTSVDDLITQTNIPTPLVHTVLLELELANRLARHPANHVSLSSFDEPVDKSLTLIY